MAATPAGAVLAAWNACDKTDTLFILICTVFCWPIIPAVRPPPPPLHPKKNLTLGSKKVGIAYSGYSWKRNGLTSFLPSLLVISVCSIQWFLIGYTLAYGEGSGPIFGNFAYIFHVDVLSDRVGTIPAILFSEFQLVFEATVCAIAVGGVCERGRLAPLVPFVFVSCFFLFFWFLERDGVGWMGWMGKERREEI